MRAQGSIQGLFHELDHEVYRHQAGRRNSDPFAVESGLFESDPLLFDITGGAETDQAADIAIAVIHHLLRIDQQGSVILIGQRITLESDIEDTDPSDDEAGQQEQVFLFRMFSQIREDLMHNEQGNPAQGQAHKDILGRMDAQIVSGKSCDQHADHRDHGKDLCLFGIPANDRQSAVDQ